MIERSHLHLKGIFGFVRPLALVGLVLLLVLAIVINTGLASRSSQSDNQAQVPTLHQLTPAPTLAIGRTDPMAGWSPYIDSTHGYSIQYPPGWFALEGDSDQAAGKHVVFTPIKPPVRVGEEADFQILLSVYPASGARTALEWLDRSFPSASGATQAEIPRKVVPVGSVWGIELSGLPSRLGTLDVVLLHKDFVLVFSLEPYEPTDEDIARRTAGSVDIFHQVVGSLQFSD